MTRADRRRQQEQRRRRVKVAAGALAVVMGGAAAALALSGGGDAPSAARRPRLKPPITTTTAPPPPDLSVTVATTKKLFLKVSTRPNAIEPPLAVLGAATDYGLPTTLLTEPSRSKAPAGWIRVIVPFRKPNETIGWVREADVTLSTTTYAINISLSQHTLVLLNAGQPVLTTSVIIGAPTSATPTGRFYLTDPVNCNEPLVPGYPVGRCTGAYGAFAIGTSGLSEVLDSFNGTIAQIAIHGTSLPDSELGKDLSNGCVRMPNDVILEFAKITPLLGTPVTITA